MKKLFLFIIAAVLSIGARADFSGSGSGTSSDPYIIMNPNQLNELRNFLNDANVYFRMEDDIDLDKWITNNNPKQGWQPVGVSASPFKGHFDGNGKTIKNLMINRTTTYVGLFGYISGADIKNLTIEGTVKGGNYTGGFAGQSEENCTINDVHFVGTVTGGDYTAGFIGMNKSSTLSSVDVKGDVTGCSNVGGVLGYSEYSTCIGVTYEGNIVGTDNVGGICGHDYDGGTNMNSTYNSCYSKGTIHANDYVAGIVGVCDKYTNVNMHGCGAIMEIFADNYVGGLCGKIESYGHFDNEFTNIDKCYAIGDIVTTGDYVGGLIGYTKPNTNSLHYDYITNCYYNGSVSGINNVGGLVGYVWFSQIAKNYCCASVNGNSDVGGLIGRVDNTRARVKSNVVLNISVNATVNNVGRIYGSTNGDIGATMGTADENRALLTTMVSANGIGLDVDDDMQNGTSFGTETFKLRATYQGLGWDFTNDWRSQETECYPYNPSQAAPPIILSGAVSGSTTIHGKSYDGGTVYVSVGNKTYTAICVGNLWDVTTDAQQAGDLIRAYAVSEGLNQSYYTTQYVEYKGSGTEEEPYQIYTADDLARLNGSYYYKLMNDINLSTYISKNSPSEGWQPIGRNGAVMAHFDGDGHTISDLWCESDKDYTGLFANASSNTICNLTVKVASGKKVKGKNYTGILLGNNTNGNVVNCNVIGDVEGLNYTGGIVGRANGCVIKSSHAQGKVVGTVLVGGMVGEANNGSISVCSADADVSSLTANAYVGGLVGSNSADVSACRSTGSVASTGTGSNAGGLIGTTTGNVTNCFSTSNVTMAFDAVYMGGLIGTNCATVEKCYASGNLDGAKWAGGLVGYSIGASAYVKNCFANNHIVNVKDPQGYAERVIGGYKDGAKTPEKNNYAYNEMQVSVNNVPMIVYDDIINGIAKTETELKSTSTYSTLGWDMENMWKIDEGNSYPVLSDVASTPSIPGGGADDNPTDVEPSTDISLIPNVVYINDIETTAGVTIKIPVSLKNNEENIVGFQFDMYLPEGVNLAKNSRGKTQAPTFNAETERTSTEYHVASVAEIEGGIKVLCYSDVNDVILGTDGVVFDFTATISDDIPEGEYNIILKNLVITNSSLIQTKIDKVVSKLIIPSYTLGDVNADTEINVTDIAATASYILGSIPSTFVFKAADINSDEEINVTDIAGIANIILKGSANTSAAKVRSSVFYDYESSLVIAPTVLIQKEQSAMMQLGISTTKENVITGFQCDVYLPKGVLWASNNRGGFSAPTFNMDFDSHTVVAAQGKDEGVRLLCYSIDNETIQGNEGSFLNLPIVVEPSLEPGEYDVVLKDIVITDALMKQQKIASCKYTIRINDLDDAVSVDSIECTEGSQLGIYDIVGRKYSSVSNLPNGVYIINGKKVIKK